MAVILASNFKGTLRILKKEIVKNKSLNLGLKEAEDSKR